MGLILDSSVLIAAERKGNNARQALSEVARSVGDDDVALSILTVVELMHGVVRADSARRQATRRRFVDELLIAIPIHS